MTKMENMSFQTTDGVRLTKIVGARCSPNGSHLVLTDWDNKAFVMVELKKDEKTITGNSFAIYMSFGLILCFGVQHQLINSNWLGRTDLCYRHM